MKIDVTKLEGPVRSNGTGIRVNVEKLNVSMYENPVNGLYLKWPLFLSAACMITGFAVLGCMMASPAEDVAADTAYSTGTSVMPEISVIRMADMISADGTDPVFEPEDLPAVTETSDPEPENVPEETVPDPAEKTVSDMEEETVPDPENAEETVLENAEEEETVSENAEEEETVEETVPDPENVGEVEETVPDLENAEEKETVPENVEEETNSETVEEETLPEEETVSEIPEEETVPENTKEETVPENTEKALKEPDKDHLEEKQEKSADLVMANVKTALNVRADASDDTEVVGLLYKDCGGRILEQKDGWTKIESGELVGWASDTYLVFGDDAQTMAEEAGSYTLTTDADSLRIRKEPGTDSSVLGTMTDTDTLEVIELADDWICVSYDGGTGYVSADYTTVEFSVNTGETMETVQKKTASKIQKDAAAKLTEEKVESTKALPAGGDDLMQLSAIIYCEAGGESYEGQVAVGAVVLNRVKSPSFPNTVSEVIRAAGQFSPVSSGRFDRVLSSGSIPAVCIQAAQDALNGANPVGSALYFKNPKKAGAHAGLTIGNHVFW